MGKLTRNELGNSLISELDGFNDQLGSFSTFVADIVTNVKSFGAKGDGVTDDTATIQNAINTVLAGNGKNTLYFPYGTYLISNTIYAYGNILLHGQDSNNKNSTIKWAGSTNVPMLDINKDNAGGGTTYRIALDKITLDGGTVTKPKGLRLHNVSEAEISRFFVKNCTDALVFDSAAIIFIDRFDTSACDRAFSFETSTASPLFNNSFISLKRANIWDTSYAVFNFRSGVMSSLEVEDCWFENFACFAKNENTGAQASGFNHFNVSKSKLSNTNSSPYSNSKLFNITAPSGIVVSQFINFSAVEVVIEVNSSDYICNFDLNGNTAGSTSIGSNFNFDNCLLFGAPSAVINSNTIKTTANFKGSTIAQTTYYSGVTIPFVAGSAKLIDLPTLISYTVSWTASTTNPTLGNGTLIGRYTVRNSLCRVQIELTFGSTTAAGSGTYNFSLPITHSTGWGKSLGTVYILDSGTTNYTGVAIVDAGASIINIAINSVASYVNATNPIAWASGDKITIVIEYPLL